MSPIFIKNLLRSSNRRRILFLALGGLLALVGLVTAHPRQTAAGSNAGQPFTQAADRYVAKSGVDAGACSDPSAPCASVQYAIDQAGADDRVLAASGVYTDINYLGGLVQIGYITKSMNLRGGYSPDFSAWDPDIYTTTLDAGGQGRVLYVSGAITPTIEGFVIAHGDSAGLGGLPSGGDIGGGILVITATATISGCQIVDNTNAGEGGGGGIYIYAANGAILESNLLSRNQARYGSAIMVYQSQATVRRNEITDNISTGGGSVAFDYAEVVMEDNTIARNINNDNGITGIFAISSSIQLLHNQVIDNTGVGVFLLETTGMTIIQNNIISRNYTGIYCYDQCLNVSVLNNQINENGTQVVPGGGIIMWGWYNSQHVTISGNTIQGNVGNQDGGGIAVHNYNHVLISDNMIDGNHAAQDGGGIYLSDVLDVTVEKNIVTGNQAGRYGGGIYQRDTYPSVDRQNTITYNRAGQSGGGIYGYYEHLTSNIIAHNETDGNCGGVRIGGNSDMMNNLIADNQAATYGSGLCLMYYDMTLLHNTVANNTGGDGSGIYAIGGGVFSITNTVLVSQTVGIVVESGVQVSLDSTLWYSNTQNWSGAGTITTTNNIYGDPDFADPSAGDYHIGAASAAKDVGVDVGVYTDFEGDPRPQDAGFDLGFDEYYAEVDFKLRKQALPERVEAGDQLTYVLAFANQGNIPATQVWITDALPAELENFTVSSTLPITPTGGVPFTWQITDLAPGAAEMITITGWIASNLPEGYVFTNTTEITSTAQIVVNHRSDDIAQAVVRLNTSPVAVNDNFSVLEDTLLSIATPGVLANDHDYDGDALTAILDSQPITGSLTFHTDGSFTYQPVMNFNGTITFTYHACDGMADSNTALVLIQVTPVNDAPVALDDRGNTLENTPVAVPVLANDLDVDGGPLSLSAVGEPLHGRAAIQGTLAVYTPTLDFSGQDPFTYTISDGQGGFDSAVVTVTVEAVNDAPVVEAGSDQSTSEGTAVIFQGSFTDEGRISVDAGYQFLWDFGDGITATGSLTSTHVYADDGAYTVTLTVTDSSGAAGQDGLIVMVGNVAPLLADIADQAAQVGQPVSIVASFTDPGWLDTYTVTIEWEQSVTETLSLPAGARQVDLEHVFARAGGYRVTVRIVDDDGGTSTIEFVVVVNPYRQYLPVMRK